MPGLRRGPRVLVNGFRPSSFVTEELVSSFLNQLFECHWLQMVEKKDQVTDVED
jgi:hypothetical protein